MNVSELITRYLRRLQGEHRAGIHPEVERISGLIPADVDTKAIYHEHLIKRHQHCETASRIGGKPEGGY